MKVGGRDFLLSKEDVEREMRGEASETIRKHFVELNGTAFPPKQVLAQVTGWKRDTFTTMEAQRVLSKLGFVCREAGVTAGGDAVWSAVDGNPAVAERLAALEAALATAQAAIAGLATRLDALETAD